MSFQFPDRRAAGHQLAALLNEYAGRPDVVVLGLPRGGVPVAYEVAQALGAPLDICVVRKLGVPGHEELAMGAIASGGVRVLNEEVCEMLQISDSALDTVTRAEAAELARRERLYRGDRHALPLRDRTVILVDDGLATGSSMRAALLAVRQKHPARVVVAAPTGALATCNLFRRLADDCVCVIMPEPFQAVGLWYENFEQTSDQDVRSLMSRATPQPAPPVGG